MSIKSIDHINIKAPAGLLRRCRDFYVSVLGLEEGERPAFNEQGYWLYAEGHALVHLTVREEQGSGPSYFNHVAFLCPQLDAIQHRLEQQQIDFTSKTTPDGRFRQLFVFDPCGLRVELSSPVTKA